MESRAIDKLSFVFQGHWPHPLCFRYSWTVPGFQWTPPETSSSSQIVWMFQSQPNCCVHKSPVKTERNTVWPGSSTLADPLYENLQPESFKSWDMSRPISGIKRQQWAGFIRADQWGPIPSPAPRSIRKPLAFLLTGSTGIEIESSLLKRTRLEGSPQSLLKCLCFWVFETSGHLVSLRYTLHRGETQKSVPLFFSVFLSVVNAGAASAELRKIL